MGLKQYQKKKKKKKGSKNEKMWKLLQTTDFKTLSNLNTMKTIPRKSLENNEIILIMLTLKLT